MAQKLEAVFRLPQNLYFDGAPVIVSAGELLKHPQSGSIFARVSWRSVTNRLIRGVKATFKCLDIAAQVIPGAVDHHYLDLNIPQGGEFGWEQMVLIPNAVTRYFAFSAITVVYADGSSWSWNESMPLEPLPQAEPLSSALEDGELQKQYRLATNARASFVPVTHKSLWLCTCGIWNGQDTCVCGLAMNRVMATLNRDSLGQAAAARLEREAEAREKAAQEQVARQEAAAREKARRKEAAALRAKKLKKAALITLAVAIVLVAAMGLGWHFALRDLTYYNRAKEHLERQEYQQAYDVFHQLGDYKDSKAYCQAFDWIVVEEYNKDTYGVGRTIRYDMDGTILSVTAGGEKREYTHDKQGRPVKVVTRNMLGDVVEKTVYSYDDEGRQLSAITTDADGQKEMEFLDAYDKNGNHTRDYYATYQYGRVKNSIEYLYEYDENGNQLRKYMELYENGKLEKIDEDVYDSQGNQLRDYYIRYEDGEVVSSWEYSYTYTFDGEGRVQEMFRTDEEDDWKNKTVYTYDARSNVIAEEEYYYSTYSKKYSLSETRTYTYDDQDRMLSSREETSWGTVFLYNYAYDDQGNETLKEYTYIRETDGKTITTGYKTVTTYDEAGNGLTQDHTNISYNNGKYSTFSYSYRHTYDAAGNVLTRDYSRTETLDGQQIQTSRTYRYSYDSEGRKLSEEHTEVAYEDGQFINTSHAYTYTYDSRGNQTFCSREETAYENGESYTYSHKNWSEYDEEDRCVRYTWEEEGETGGWADTYTWDEYGNLLTQEREDLSSGKTEIMRQYTYAPVFNEEKFNQK